MILCTFKYFSSLVFLPVYLFSTLQGLVVTICTTRFYIQQLHVLPTQCICVFCVDLRTNSDYFSIN